jgi:hypothetical protein
VRNDRTVIARSATHDEAIQSGVLASGLLRSARNDEMGA